MSTRQGGEPRTLSHGAPCARALSATRPTPMAPLQTPMALVVQVLAALTEGGGINAATRLYGVSNKRISRGPERLSGLKNLAVVRVSPPGSAADHGRR
jgi:hypothetical protein